MRCFLPPALLRRPDRLLAPCCCVALALTVPALRGQSASMALQPQPGAGSGAPALSGDTMAAAVASFRPSPEDDGSGPYRITPERRALLNTIRYAEGTWTAGRPDGYRMIYGGSLVDDLARHPEITVRSNYTSAAAGAYQFLPGTWREAARRLGLQDFRPASQDQAALYLVEKRGALARFDRNGLCAEVLARLAPEWASLPTHSGGSYYGQPVHGAQALLRFYRAELARLRNQQQQQADPQLQA